ncbi:MAG: hypothetical protein WCI05_05885 [Myxococcales bacterium]
MADAKTITEVEGDLRGLVERFGPGLATDLARCRAILKDTLPSNKRELRGLLAAAEEGVPDRLQRSAPGHALEAAVAACTKSLADGGLEEALARWSVEAWAVALGLTVTRQSATAVPRLPAPPVPVAPRKVSPQTEPYPRQPIPAPPIPVAPVVSSPAPWPVQPQVSPPSNNKMLALVAGGLVLFLGVIAVVVGGNNSESIPLPRPSPPSVWT